MNFLAISVYNTLFVRFNKLLFILQNKKKLKKSCYSLLCKSLNVVKMFEIAWVIYIQLIIYMYISALFSLDSSLNVNSWYSYFLFTELMNANIRYYYLSKVNRILSLLSGIINRESIWFFDYLWLTPGPLADSLDDYIGKECTLWNYSKNINRQIITVLSTVEFAAYWYYLVKVYETLQIIKFLHFSTERSRKIKTLIWN